MQADGAGTTHDEDAHGRNKRKRQDDDKYVLAFDKLHESVVKKSAYKQYKNIIYDFMEWCDATRCELLPVASRLVHHTTPALP